MVTAQTALTKTPGTLPMLHFYREVALMLAHLSTSILFLGTIGVSMIRNDCIPSLVLHLAPYVHLMRTYSSADEC